jgi:hypothetical protein
MVRAGVPPVARLLMGATVLPRGNLSPRGHAGLRSELGDQRLPAGKSEGQPGTVPVTRVAYQDLLGGSCRLDATGGVVISTDRTFHPNESCGVDFDDEWLRVLSHLCPPKCLAPAPRSGHVALDWGPEERRGDCDKARERATPAPVQLVSLCIYRYVQYRRAG